MLNAGYMGRTGTFSIIDGRHAPKPQQPGELAAHCVYTHVHVLSWITASYSVDTLDPLLDLRTPPPSAGLATYLHVYIHTYKFKGTP